MVKCAHEKLKFILVRKTPLSYLPLCHPIIWPSEMNYKVLLKLRMTTLQDCIVKQVALEIWPFPLLKILFSRTQRDLLICSF